MLSKLDFYSHDNTFGDKSQGSSMAMHNGFGAFEDRHEEWVSYAERLEQYFTTKDKDCREEVCYLAKHMQSGNLPS